MRALVLLLALVACRKTVDHAGSSTHLPADASGASDASAGPSGPLDASAGIDGEAASAAPGVEGGAYAEITALDREDYGTNRIVGFSADDRYLGYEISRCDACPQEFHFRGPGVPPLDFGYFNDPTLDEAVREAKAKTNDAKVEAKLLALGASKWKDERALRGPFPYPDLVFAEASVNAADGSVTLLVGAHLRGEPPVFPMRIAVGRHPLMTSLEHDPRYASLPPTERRSAIEAMLGGDPMHEARLGYVNVTRDGRDLGAVAIVTGDYWYENGGVGRMPAGAFAAQVYNDTGMKALAANDNHAAADLFGKASAAMPEDALFSYNLACAAARDDDPRAEAALATAIRRNPTFRARARKDPDFARVRAAAWFTRLTR